MQVGSFKQKASPFLVKFTFICIFVITGLLYILQRTEAISDNFSSLTQNPTYID